jgi:hypothetical protein
MMSDYLLSLCWLEEGGRGKMMMLQMIAMMMNRQYDD